MGSCAELNHVDWIIMRRDWTLTDGIIASNGSALSSSGLYYYQDWIIIKEDWTLTRTGSSRGPDHHE